MAGRRGGGRARPRPAVPRPSRRRPTRGGPGRRTGAPRAPSRRRRRAAARGAAPARRRRRGRRGWSRAPPTPVRRPGPARGGAPGRGAGARSRPARAAPVGCPGRRPRRLEGLPRPGPHVERGRHRRDGVRRAVRRGQVDQGRLQVVLREQLADQTRLADPAGTGDGHQRGGAQRTAQAVEVGLTSVHRRRTCGARTAGQLRRDRQHRRGRRCGRRGQSGVLHEDRLLEGGQLGEGSSPLRSARRRR